MSASAPKVLSRKPNGTPRAPARLQSDSHPRPSWRLGGERPSSSNGGKPSHDVHPQRPTWGRGAGDNVTKVRQAVEHEIQSLAALCFLTSLLRLQTVANPRSDRSPSLTAKAKSSSYDASRPV